MRHAQGGCARPPVITRSAPRRWRSTTIGLIAVCIVLSSCADGNTITTEDTDRNATICERYDGDNPSLSVLEESLVDYRNELLALNREFNAPDASSTEAALTAGAAEVLSTQAAEALALSPPGAIAEFTEFFCDGGNLPDELWEIVWEWQSIGRELIEALKRDPRWASFDFEGYTSAVGRVSQRYPLTTATAALEFCGFTSENGMSPIRIVAGLQNPVPISAFTLTGHQIVCPDVVGRLPNREDNCDDAVLHGRDGQIDIDPPGRFSCTDSKWIVLLGAEPADAPGLLLTGDRGGFNCGETAEAGHDFRCETALGDARIYFTYS